MSLVKTDIEKIAHLARLAINVDDIPAYTRDLNTILNLASKLNHANTSAIIPMAHPFDAKQRLRPDKITETDQRELFQSIAPNAQAGVYLVPQVIE